jgi:serine protease
VQHKPRLYVVFWGPAWRTDSPTGAAGFYLLNFYAGLGEGGETWSLANSQYTDATGHPVFGASELVTFGVDTSAPPSMVTPGDIAAEAAAGAGAFGIKDVADDQVVVVSQPGTCFSDGFAGSSCTPVAPAYCGWHSAIGFGGGQISFTNLPFQLDAKTACGENFINLGAAGTLDGFSIVGGHEYAEAVTDPVPPSGGSTWRTASAAARSPTSARGRARSGALRTRRATSPCSRERSQCRACGATRQAAA